MLVAARVRQKYVTSTMARHVITVMSCHVDKRANGTWPRCFGVSNCWGCLLNNSIHS